MGVCGLEVDRVFLTFSTTECLRSTIRAIFLFAQSPQTFDISKHLIFFSHGRYCPLPPRHSTPNSCYSLTVRAMTCPWPTWFFLFWRSPPQSLPLPCSTCHSYLLACNLSASEGSRKFWWPKADRDKCFITRRPQIHGC